MLSILVLLGAIRLVSACQKIFSFLTANNYFEFFFSCRVELLRIKKKNLLLTLIIQFLLKNSHWQTNNNFFNVYFMLKAALLVVVEDILDEDMDKSIPIRFVKVF